MLDRVHVCYAFEPDELIEALEGLLADTPSPHTRLLVVDNISYYFRHFRPTEMDLKMRTIRYMGMLLRRFARFLRIPVIVHNHMSLAYCERDRPETGMQLSPYLGDTWAFMLDTRIKLGLCAGGVSRSLLVSKSPYELASMKPIQFKVTETGIERLD